MGAERVEHPVEIGHENRRLGALGPRLIRFCGAVGAIGLGTAIVTGLVTDGGADRFFHAYLVSYCYVLSLALGALFFTMLQHLTRSGWSVVVRRLAEGLAGTLPLLAVLVLPVLLGMRYLYEWTDPNAMAGDPGLSAKAAYLNPTFFVIRVVVYFVVWVGLARFFFRTSVKQDETGDVALTLRMQWVSGPAMVLFAVTITFAAFDLLMSLDPHWYSTIFGVYYFAGGVVGFFALLVVVVALVQALGRLPRAITTEHYHDLGKLVFAFVVFWAYIAFSQYLLIWYGDIPEETHWYLRRQTGDWAAVSLLLLFGHFVVPFLALLSRTTKRRKGALWPVAIWVLLMHWVDIYWLVMPEMSPGRAPLGLPELGCFVGLGGLFLAAATLRLRDRALIPEGDPRVAESLTFENV
jgi:hypothetical protein